MSDDFQILGAVALGLMILVIPWLLAVRVEGEPRRVGRRPYPNLSFREGSTMAIETERRIPLMSVFEAKEEFARLLSESNGEMTMERAGDLFWTYGPRNAFYIMGIADELPPDGE